MYSCCRDISVTCPLDLAACPLHLPAYDRDPGGGVGRAIVWGAHVGCGIFASDWPLLVTSFPVERFLTLYLFPESISRIAPLVP